MSRIAKTGRVLLMIAVAAALFQVAGGGLVRYLLLHALPGLVQQEFGWRVSYAQADWDLLSGFDFSGVVIEKTAPVPPALRITAERIALRYRPVRLLDGLESFLAAMNLTASGGKIDVVLPWPSAEAGEKARLPALFPSELPAFLPVFRLADFGLNVRRGAALYWATGITLSAGPAAGGGGAADLHIAQAGRGRPGEKAAWRGLDGRLEYDGKEYRLPFLDLGGKRIIADGSVGLRREAGAAVFAGSAVLPGGELEFSGRWSEERQAVRGRAELSSPTLEPPPGFAPKDQVLPGHLTLAADVVLEGGAGEKAGGVLRLDARGWKYGEIGVRRAEAEMVLQDGYLASGALAIETTNSTLSARVSALSLPALLAGDVKELAAAAEADLTFRSENLSEFAAFLPPEAAARLGELPEHLVAIGGTLAKGRLSIAQGLVRSGGDELLLHRASFPLPGVRADWLTAPIDIGGRASCATRTILSAIPGLPRLEGNLRAEIGIRGSFAAPAGTAALTGDAVKLDGLPFGRVNLFARADGSKAVLEDFSAVSGRDTMRASAEIDLAGGRLTGARAAWHWQDITPYLRGFFPAMPSVSGTLAGTVSARGTLDHPEIEGELLLQQPGVKGFHLDEAALRGRYADGVIQFERLSTRREDLRLQASGSLACKPAGADRKLRLVELVIGRDEAGFSLVNPVDVQVQPDGLRLDDQLVLTDGRGTLALTGRWNGLAGNLSLNGVNLSGENFLPSSLRQRLRLDGLNFALLFNGSSDAPSVGISGRIAALASPDFGDVLAGVFDLDYGPGGLVVRTFDFSSTGGAGVQASGQLPRLFGAGHSLPGPLDFRLHVRIPDVAILPGAAAYVRAGGSLEAQAVLRGDPARPEGGVRLRGENLVLNEAAALLPAVPFSFDCDLSADRDLIELRSLRVNSAGLDFFAAGDWQGRQPLRAILQEGRLPREGVFRVKSGITLESAAWLGERFHGLRHLSGRLEAEAELAGSPENPVVSLSAWMNDGEYRPAQNLPAVRDMALAAVIGRDSLQIRELRGTLGGAPFVLGGTVGLADWRPEHCDLNLQGRNLLFHRSEGIKVRGDALLELTGPVPDLLLQGTVTLTDGAYTRPFDMVGYLLQQGFAARKPSGGAALLSFPEGPLQHTRLAVRLKSVKPFLVQNNVIRGAFRPDLQLTGTGELPLFEGEVYIDPSRLVLPAGRMKIESGVLRFLPGQPDRPQLVLQASARMRGYDVVLLVDGPVEEPVVSVSSVPPLTGEELVLLLLTGKTPQNGAGTELRAAGSGVALAVFLGRGVLARWFGAEETEESILDRFELNIGQGITEKGDDTVEAQFRLAENVFREQDALYIMTEKDLYDDFNAGLRLVFRFR